MNRSFCRMHNNNNNHNNNNIYKTSLKASVIILSSSEVCEALLPVATDAQGVRPTYLQNNEQSWPAAASAIVSSVPYLSWASSNSCAQLLPDIWPRPHVLGLLLDPA